MKYTNKAFKPLKRGKRLVQSGKDFIPGVAKEANFIDEEIVQRIYISMIRYIVTVLRKKGVIRLPNFGDFWVVFRQDKVLNIPKYQGGGRRIIPRMRQVKFECCPALKSYFKLLDGGTSFGEKGEAIDDSKNMVK
jgi:nucleoid DNA-binding protein